MMKLLNLEELREKKGIPDSNSTLLRKEQSGRFPRRIRLSTQRYAWSEDEIDEYIKSLIAKRDEQLAESAA